MTPVYKSPAKTRRSPARVRKALNQEHHSNQHLTDQIMSEAAHKAQAASQALAITHGGLTEAEMKAWHNDLTMRLARIEQNAEQNLGFIEEQIALESKELLRLMTERSAQAKANAIPCCCHNCKGPLENQKCLPRHIDSRYGRLTIYRRYGWCDDCEAWFFPADHALGLAQNAPASPYLQELAALLVSKMPPQQAQLVAERLGFHLSCSTLHRQAHREGLKAQKVRSDSIEQLDSWEGILELAAHAEQTPAQPFTLIIEIDAWNIRERDDWGKTDDLRALNQEVKRWHWVYMGTVFRMDHRTTTTGERAVISQRGFVATRHGIEALMIQLYREAIARGLGQAQEVLVIADGAVWIWNAVKDRFPDARQRLDLFHGDEHLWAVANDLYGRGTPEASAWVKPLLDSVRHDKTPAVIQTLSQLQPTLNQALQKKVQEQIEYFENQQNRMHYKAIIDARKACDNGTATDSQKQLANEPLGSGAIESTCRQYQCRFKRTGQFWTKAGDEALMCLETFWRNDRWHQLYPHASLSNPSRN